MFNPSFLIYFFFLFLVYDVTRRDTFTNLSEVWSKEVELYSTNQNCVKMLVGNKVDRVSCVLFLLEIYDPMTVKSFNNEVFENKNYGIQLNVWLCSALRK